MIVIVAVSYKGVAHAKRLVESLLAQTYLQWRLVLVDNARQEAEASAWRRLQQIDERVSVLHAPFNLGYLGAASWAYDRIEPDLFDWLVVSNVDLIYRRDALEELSRIHDRAIGAVAPSVISQSTGADQNPHLRRRPSGLARYRRRLLLGNVVTAQVAVGLVWLRARLHSSRSGSSVDGHSPSTIYAPHGSCMCLSSRFFERGGTLRYPLFLFGEEVFIAEECRRISLRVKYVPGMVISHVEHAQIGWIRPRWILEETVKAARYVFDATKA